MKLRYARILSLLLCAALACSILAGCGGSTASSSEAPSSASSSASSVASGEDLPDSTKMCIRDRTSTLGTAAIAANAVANTTTTFLNIPANAVGMAALTVVGQCLGAGEKEQAVYYLSLIHIW